MIERDAHRSTRRPSMESEVSVNDTDSVVKCAYDKGTQGITHQETSGQDCLRHVHGVLGVGSGKDERRVRTLQRSRGVCGSQGGVHTADRTHSGQTAPGPSVQQPSMCEPRPPGACHAGGEQPAHVGTDYALPQRAPQDAREYDVQKVRGPRVFRVQPSTRTS